MWAMTLMRIKICLSYENDASYDNMLYNKNNGYYNDVRYDNDISYISCICSRGESLDTTTCHKTVVGGK